MRARRWLVAVACAVAAMGATAGSATAAPIAPWDSTFATDDFTEWTWWGQGDPGWGTISVESPYDEGIPWLDDLTVGRFEVTAQDIIDDSVDAKVYKRSRETDRYGVHHPPSDVSAAYSAWYYLPEDYTMPRGGRGGVNIFQFKEDYEVSGSDTSDPLWWLNIGGAHWAQNLSPATWIGDLPTTEEQPAVFLNRFGNTWARDVRLMLLPLGRWFEIRAELHQSNRIDFWVDGTLIDTADASEYPVSPMRGADSRGWTFGVGNYQTGDNDHDPTVLYVDRAEIEALGTTAPTVTTAVATNVIDTSAALKATVRPNGLATTYWFEYGTSASYGTRVPIGYVDSDGSAHEVARSIGGLSRDTTYHYRVVATNYEGTTNGADETFRTQNR